MQRVVLLVMTDTHGGHKTGLLSPDTVLYDENEQGQIVEWHPQQNEFQKYQWRFYVDEIIPAVKETAGQDPLMFLHLGDQVHGNKHPEQIISTRIADQIEIGIANLAPVFTGLPTLTSARLLAGTGAHEFGEGSAALLIASRLREMYKDPTIRALYHGLASINGAQVDYSHHGPGQSIREWLKGNDARFYLRNLIYKSIGDQKPVPDLVLRGHVHTPINEVISMWSNNRMLESRIVVCPPMAGMNDFARQVTRSEYVIVIGATIIEIVDGKILKPTFITRTLDIRTKEKFFEEEV